MKQIKKIMAVVIAAVMVLSMSAMAWAADETPVTYTITINKDTTDKAAHTYGAYQIFKGKLETVEGKSVLSDIEWGDNVNGATLITELKKINTFASLADNATASVVARAISDANLGNDTAGAQAIADAVAASLSGSAKATGDIAANATQGTISGLLAGYYFVKDERAVTGEGAKTRYILEVVNNVSVTEKANVPTVTKKVQEKNDTTGQVSDWQDAADYDIGDTIPYQLTGTLPGRFAEFDTYKVYKFTDTLSTGLTPPAADAITVKLNGTTDITSKFDIAVNGQVITISLKSAEDMKSIASAATDTVVVNYSATLNNNAVVGSAGNPNTVKLEFTNNPNGEQDGEIGTTPEDKVTVFTYTIEAKKVGEDGTTPLNGAGFTLFKKKAAATEGGEATWEKVGDEITGTTTFTFNGVDAGEYKLEETTVPAGYNKADDIEFTVTATYDTTAAEPELKTLTVTPSDAGFTCTVDDGKVSTNVVNRKGSTLPSTGGIGTTIFYVIGAILVLGAGILLVSKRRMSAN